MNIKQKTKNPSSEISIDHHGAWASVTLLHRPDVVLGFHGP